MKAQSAWQPADSSARRFSRPNAGWLVVLLVWGLAAALAAPSALAQGKGKGKGNRRGNTGAKGKKQNQKQPKAKSRKPDPKKKKKPSNALADLKRLPSMNINKPLLTKLQYEELEKSLTRARYQKVLSAGDLGPGPQKVIADWAKWRIYGMTRPEQRENLFDIRRRVLFEVRMAAKSLKGGPNTVPFRTAVLQQLTKHCADVLDNNYYVRLQAVMILGNLNLKEYDPTAKPKRPPVAYGPAYKPLLEKVMLLPDKVQPVSIKIAAAVGMRRIALLAPRNKDRNTKMAVELIKEFNRKNTHPWYQARLAEALGAIEFETNAAGQAIIVQALTKAVINLDKSRTYPVRAQAAMALGRAGLARDVNIELVMHEIVNLAVEMSEQYNADIAADKSLPSHWTGSFLKLYFAFKPVDRLEEEFLFKDRLSPKDRYAGFLAKGHPKNAQIKAAYEQIRPVVKHVIQQSDKVVKAPVPTETLKDMRTWLAARTSKDFKVQDGGTLPAVRSMKAAQGKPKVTANGIAGP